MRLLLSTAVCALIGFVGVAVAITSAPCPTEDSSNCYWNAAQQGNGTGQSFWDIGGHPFYLPSL